MLYCLTPCLSYLDWHYSRPFEANYGLYLQKKTYQMKYYQSVRVFWKYEYFLIPKSHGTPFLLVTSQIITFSEYLQSSFFENFSLRLLLRCNFPLYKLFQEMFLVTINSKFYSRKYLFRRYSSFLYRRLFLPSG